MNEKGHLYIPRIWLIIIIIVAILITVIVVSLIISNSTRNVKVNEQISWKTIDDIIDEKEPIDYTKLDEGTANEELPKINLNKIATINSTIDGRIPSFYNPVIPKGFKAVGVEQDETIDEKAKWGELNSYLNGLVIEDEKGNQFVWVPVENIELFKRTDWQKNMPKETINANYTEPIQDEEEAYQKMYYKVKKYGGFYVGRYETGDTTAASERIEINPSDSIGIKKYLNTYNYVPFKQTSINGRQITGATEIAKNFAKKNGYTTIVSSVVYGVQWDSILRFIVSEKHNVNNSTSWGNYLSSKIIYTDINGNSNVKEQQEDRLLKAGSSEDAKAKNIYDIAGNLYEWTMESAGNNIRTVRGGCYVVNVGQLAAARYAYNESTANNAIGFRISFYIN